MSAAHTASAPRDRADALPGRPEGAVGEAEGAMGEAEGAMGEAEGRGDVRVVRGLPVMNPHDSLTPLTRE
ncbi:hypothetical protein GCM10023100_43860 [Actinocorallia cavernae]|uniref:Uncharacterized protein n=2 Tax=Actinomycetes TaxID=1760 RepID=A0ABP8STH3_9ACTN